MAIIILKADSFKSGKYNIPDSKGNFTRDNVKEYIDRFEKQYIYQLLGVVLGDLFITWLQANQTPANADYLKILNAFADDNLNGSGIVQSLGMLELLQACIYYEYVKNSLVISQAGVQDIQAETGVSQSPYSTMRFAENKFNGVLNTVYAIQWYCTNNSTAFPDFNGQIFTIKASQFFM